MELAIVRVGQMDRKRQSDYGWNLDCRAGHKRHMVGSMKSKDWGRGPYLALPRPVLARCAVDAASERVIALLVLRSTCSSPGPHTFLPPVMIKRGRYVSSLFPFLSFAKQIIALFPSSNCLSTAIPSSNPPRQNRRTREGESLQSLRSLPESRPTCIEFCAHLGVCREASEQPWLAVARDNGDISKRCGSQD